MQRRRVPDKKSPVQKMAKNMSVFAFLMCLVVIGLIFAYYQHKKEGGIVSGENEATTEVEKLAAKDLELGYPETPVEVMKLFGRLNQCMYNTSVDDEEFNQLLTQLRTLYSTTLLEQNTFEEQKAGLKAEIQDFSSNKRRIVNYTVDKSSSVKYRQINGQQCAYIQMAYFMSENSKYSKSFQDYVLVKEDNNWKILAFKKNTGAESEKSEWRKEEKNGA